MSNANLIQSGPSVVERVARIVVVSPVPVVSAMSVLSGGMARSLPTA